MLTITEAMAEIKLIDKKCDKLRSEILSNLTRYKHIKDQFESEGGLQKAMSAKMQSFQDLQTRKLNMKTSINYSNSLTKLTVNSKTKTVSEWLIWRRDIAGKLTDIFSRVSRDTKIELDRFTQEPTVHKDADGNHMMCELEAAFDIPIYLNMQTEIMEILEQLDGKLSLHNAITTIELD